MKLFGQFVASCGIYMLATCILPMAVADDKANIAHIEPTPFIKEYPVKGDYNVASRDNVHIKLDVDGDCCKGYGHRYGCKYYGVPDKYDNYGYYGNGWEIEKDYRYRKYGSVGWRSWAQ